MSFGIGDDNADVYTLDFETDSLAGSGDGILGIGAGTDTVTYGFPAITSTTHTVMQDGFQAIGLTVVVGGSGLKATGDISLPKRVTTGT